MWLVPVMLPLEMWRAKDRRCSWEGKPLWQVLLVSQFFLGWRKMKVKKVVLKISKRNVWSSDVVSEVKSEGCCRWTAVTEVEVRRKYTLGVVPKHQHSPSIGWMNQNVIFLLFTGGFRSVSLFFFFSTPHRHVQLLHNDIHFLEIL